MKIGWRLLELIKGDLEGMSGVLAGENKDSVGFVHATRSRRGMNKNLQATVNKCFFKGITSACEMKSAHAVKSAPTWCSPEGTRALTVRFRTFHEFLIFPTVFVNFQERFF
jgi:hypothetical protein